MRLDDPEMFLEFLTAVRWGKSTFNVGELTYSVREYAEDLMREGARVGTKDTDDRNNA